MNDGLQVQELPAIYRPGALLWGGGGWKAAQSLPDLALDQWEHNNGFEGQCHLQWIQFNLIHNNPAGLARQLDQTSRVISGGGVVKFYCFGTPQHLASVPIDMRGNRGERGVYVYYPPTNYQAWAELYLEFVDTVVTRFGTDNVYFSIWTEPGRYGWRGSDEEYLSFYGVVQDAIREYQARRKVKLNVGAFQLSDLDDHQLGKEPYAATPIFRWLRRFMRRAVQHKWQLDYFTYFRYSGWPSDAAYTTTMRRYLDRAGYGSTPIFRNDANTSTRLQYEDLPGYPAVERDSEIGAAWTVATLDANRDEGVERADIGFLRNSSTYGNYNPDPPMGAHWPFFWGGIGLTTHLYSFPRPRFHAATLLNMLYPWEVVTGQLENELTTTNDDQSMIRKLAWTYEPHSGLGNTYQDVRRQARFGKTIPTALHGYSLDRVAIVDANHNNAWSFVMPFVTEALSRYPDQRIPDWLVKKADKLIDGVRQFDVITWLRGADVGSELYLDSYAVAMLEYRRIRG